MMGTGGNGWLGHIVSEKVGKLGEGQTVKSMTQGKMGWWWAHGTAFRIRREETQNWLRVAGGFLNNPGAGGSSLRGWLSVM